MPTGVAIRDPREQLFDAAERVLLQGGPNALTSRSVTAEAACAKGVLHKYFADFDAFLCELVIDRIGRIERQAEALREAAGTRTVVANLTDVLTDLSGSVAVSILGLVTARDGLRARLRETMPTGVPVLREASDMIVSYLAAEQELGRVAGDADVRMLALMLIGTWHLLVAGREGNPPETEAVEEVVTSVLGPMP